MSTGDHISTHIGMAIQSPIAVKSTGVRQSSGALTNESRSQVIETIDVIRSLLGHPDVSTSRDELASLLEEVEREAKVEVPEAGRVRAAWDRLKPKLIDSAPSIAKVIAHLTLPDIFKN